MLVIVCLLFAFASVARSLQMLRDDELTRIARWRREREWLEQALFDRSRRD